VLFEKAKRPKTKQTKPKKERTEEKKNANRPKSVTPSNGNDKKRIAYTNKPNSASRRRSEGCS
jgi:hypothetical protein